MGLHIGIIMDGNGRWATVQNKPRLYGHAAGVEALRALVRQAPELGVDSITLYAFAIANWKRDQQEVDGLWKLFDQFFSTDINEMIDKGVRVRLIGNRAGLPTEILKKAEEAEQRSFENKKFLLQVALNYDGIDEVVRLMQRAIAAGLAAEEVTAEYVTNNLDTLPGTEPDIVVRTGMPAPRAGMGVWRSSAFLPIQSAQSVCIGTDVLWPDFTIEHLAAVIDYADPDARLFGGQRA